MKARFYECGHPDLPDHAASFGFDDAGNIYIYSGMVGNPNEVFLCASYDSEPVMYDKNKEYMYVKSDWAEKEFMLDGKGNPINPNEYKKWRMFLDAVNERIDKDYL